MNTDKHRWKRILIYLCSSVFICGSTSLRFAIADELPRTPRLLLDRKDIDVLKQKIQGPFANQWKELRDGVDREMEKPIELPPRGGNWSHNYVCPEHRARLKLGKQIGPWQWEHICPIGPHVLRGDPSKGTTDFDGNAIMRRIWTSRIRWSISGSSIKSPATPNTRSDVGRFCWRMPTNMKAIRCTITRGTPRIARATRGTWRRNR